MAAVACGALGGRQLEDLAQLDVAQVLTILAVLHRRVRHEDTRLDRPSGMGRSALRKPPGLQVLAVGDCGVLGLELVDVASYGELLPPLPRPPRIRSAGATEPLSLETGRSVACISSVYFRQTGLLTPIVMVYPNKSNVGG